MDEIAKYSKERWRALAEADALFTRPHLDLTAENAGERVDPEGILGDLADRDVLCLAGGGGQQSAAFALLGARVTVFDLSEEQLERDQRAAAQYQKTITTVQGDMRDLSPLAPASFDLVYQPYSLGFVPDPREVFAQVARVLRPEGMYYFNTGNPFYLGMTEADWNGEGYTLKLPYVNGAQIVSPDAEWAYDRSTAAASAVPELREYRHTFSHLLNSLIELGFTLARVSDSKDLNPDKDAAPGTWDHFVSIAPSFLAYWLRFQPRGE